MKKKLCYLTLGALASLTFAVPACAEETARPNITAYKAQDIAIDGSLDEWNLESPAIVKDAAQVIRDVVFWQGENDCSAAYYLAWDEDNLYMAADVTEDTPLGAIEMLPIDGEDNLKLYISTDPSADPERTEYGTNDFLVYFVMDEGYWDTAIDRSMVPKESRERFVSVGMDGGESVLDGYECAVSMTATGFIWEAVIPWACFSNDNIAVYEPQAGDTLSCNFAITDISYPCPGTEYIPQMAWSGTENINTNPSEWGSVTLAE
ncbi:MAG: sugar-binding protein [Eubacteriales bacterium]|nr:sugar-binding protein [Eubacteriales bacterium]